MIARLIIVIGVIAMFAIAAAAMFGAHYFLSVQSNDFIYGFLCGGMFVGVLIYAIWKLDPLSFVSPQRKIEIARRRGHFDLIAQFEEELAARKKIPRQMFVFFACLFGFLVFLKALDYAGFKPYEPQRAGANSLSK